MLTFAEPGRLIDTWRYAAYLVEYEKPENVRKRAIDAELAHMGLFRKMAVASQAVISAAFRDEMDRRVDERRAAKDEKDLALICEDVLRGLGVDMEDLHVRLRRATAKEVRKSGAPRRAVQLKLRVRPTIEAARAAIAAVDAQSLEVAGAVSAAEVAEGSDEDDISETEASGAGD